MLTKTYVIMCHIELKYLVSLTTILFDQIIVQHIQAELFAFNIFKWIFLDEDFYILIPILMKLVNSVLGNKSVLAQVMTWQKKRGDWHLTEPLMIISIFTYTITLTLNKLLGLFFLNVI